MRVCSTKSLRQPTKRDINVRFSQRSILQYDSLVKGLLLVFLLMCIAQPSTGETDLINTNDEAPSSCKILEDLNNNQKIWEPLDSNSELESVVGWLQDLEGAIVETEKFQILKRNPSDESLNPEFDFVATQDIPEGTVLMEIPQSAMIGIGLDERRLTKLENDKLIDEEDQHLVAMCMAVEEIVKEHRKGIDSIYQPYLEFIFGSGNPKGRRPSSWSYSIQTFFWAMIGQYNTVYSPSAEERDVVHERECRDYMRVVKQHIEPTKDDEDSIEDKALDYFSVNAWGTSLIPLFDMIPHRNGEWKNIEARFVEAESKTPISVEPRRRRFDTLRLVENNNDSNVNLVVYAQKSIKRGDPLRVSLNQCEHLGCEKLGNGYTTSDILADTGRIEEYPRRWFLRTDPEDVNDFVFDVDLVDSDNGEGSQTKVVRVIITNHPDDALYKHAFFSASITRWSDTVNEWIAGLELNLESAKDRNAYNIIREYQRAYTEAFELAWIHRDDGVASRSAMDNIRIENTTQNIMEGYDDLSRPKGLGLRGKGWYRPCAEGALIPDSRRIARIRTLYQGFEYWYDEENDNTDLRMSTWLHSSSNLRAHYHETMIHAPLQYVKNPKRVAFIGGGDNMVLAEFLKYDSIEKIVGLELDQQVCRLSMKYFGTTPAYHDERVEWWYGNGAVSIQLLPDDYWGSFDLVVVDLLTDIADGIKVTAGMSISEAAMLLMKPDGGVVVRNDDFADRSEVLQSLAQKTLFYDHYDVPRLCELSTTIASNSVDFTRDPRYNHGIDTLARLVNFEEEAFSGWSRYFDTTNATSGEKLEEVCNKIQVSLQEIHPSSSGGVILIIEAENVTASLEPPSLPILHEEIRHVAEEFGLSPLKVTYQPDQDIHAFMLLCENGYIKMHTYPEFQYVAFDLALWGHSSFVDQAKVIQKRLVASVGGGSIEGSVSVFRVVTGGMDDIEDTKESENFVVEKALQYYCGKSSNEVRAKGGDDKRPAKRNEEMPMFVDQSIVILQLFSSITRWSDQKPFFVIFCGKEDHENCQGYSSVASQYKDVFHPIYSCESFDDMKGCELELTEKLLGAVSDHKLLDGFVLDRSVPFEMGRILHKVFNNTLVQSQTFERSFSALAPSGEGTWRNILLDRFRTEIIIAPPIFKVDFEISNGAGSENWSLVSIGNHNFHFDFQSSLQNIEQRTGWATTSRKILDSITPVIPDWEHSHIQRDEDFFQEEVMKQWLGQKPVVNQYVLQMEPDFQQAPVEVGEVVLVGREFMNDGVMADKNGFMTEFYEATITEIKGADKIVGITSPYVLQDGSVVSYEYKYYNQQAKTIPRRQIRKISPHEKERQFTVGDLVLVKQRHHITKEAIPVAWFAAVIMNINDHGAVVRAKEIGIVDETQLRDIPLDDIMVYFESPEFSIKETGISVEKLNHAFEKSVTKAGLARGGYQMEPSLVGNGLLVSFLSPKGNGIMKWDGAGRVEVNMMVIEGRYKKPGVNFDYEINLFSLEFRRILPGLKIIAQDSFPRGYGKVVTFPNELLGRDGLEPYTPHWMKGHIPPSSTTTSLLTE